MSSKLILIASIIFFVAEPCFLQAQTATSTALTASPNVVAFGAVATLRATVTPSTATGKVTFYDGVNVLGEATLSGGVAQLSTTLLTTGIQSTTARYDGATSFGPSLSAAAPVTVNPQASGSFSSIGLLTAGANPSAVATGDFNGDGHADLIVANQFSPSVEVFLGNGNGTFQNPTTYSVTRPTAVLTGDFNGDGITDFAVVQSDAQSVQIFLGNGDGTFVAGSSPAVGTSPLGIIAADFNGDGVVDLATSNLGNNDISVLIGVGDGTFLAPVSVGVSGYLERLASGDFNGDGKPDIAVAIYDQSVVDVLIGNGDGTFQAPVSYAVGAFPVDVAVGDLNGDGKVDLAVANSGTPSDGATVSVLLGNGNGSFGNAATITGFSGTQAVLIADFNGDGKRDLAVANSTSNTVVVLAGNGSGSFYPPITFSAGSSPEALAIADFNGDGKIDLAVADFNGTPNVDILAGNSAIVTAVQGNSQSASTGAPFAIPLEAQVTGFGAPLPGTPVAFAAPTSGASGVFADGDSTITVNADANGYATASTLTANGVTGSYQVIASADGGSAAFLLTNNSSNCTLTFSLGSVTLDSNGGSAPVTVTPNPVSCSYIATPSASWITVAPGSATGVQTFTITLAPFTGGTADRTGSVAFGAQSLPVTQAFTAQKFTDVPPSAYYFDAVNLLSDHGVTDGCTATQYCPTQDVTRAQMAVFIVRTVYGGDDFTYNPTPYFTDVTPSTFGFQWIQKLYELGITTGCAPSLYCPTSNVARDQMAVFIIRARYGATTAFTYPTTPYFTDVPPTEFAFQWVQRMKEDNITSGCTATQYCPSESVTRGDMAIFIVRGGFNQLLPTGTPVISAISPTTLAQGASGTFTVTGVNTNFISGVTTFVPVGGVTASNLTVLGPTQFTVTLTASSTALLQPEPVYVQTEPQEAVLPNAFTVTAPPPQ